MRAYRCETFLKPPSIVVNQTPRPQPAANELLIRVVAVGVGYVDALMCSGGYQVKSSLPFTPCSEAAGEVIEIGADVTDFRVGDRVLALATGALAEFAV